MTKTDKKTALVFVFHGVLGGVPSFYRNIINNTSLRNEIYIKVILLHDAEDKRPRFTDSLLADEVLDFRYSKCENHFYIARRLALSIGPLENAKVITDNMLTLNASTFLRNGQSVIYMVHDYFYVGWALQYRRTIDMVVAHSSFFRDILLAASIKDFRTKAYYQPYGVDLPAVTWQKRPAAGTLKLVFLGRLTEGKGVLLLKEIDDLLQASGIPVQWLIIGQGPMQETLHRQWSKVSYAQFIGAENTDHVFALLEDQDVLVFPSWFEGTPVAIMEAMSRGVVPVVSDLPGGTRDMVISEVGYRCDTMDAATYAEAITALHQDRALLQKMQNACIERCRKHFDIKEAADSYVRLYLSVTRKKSETGQNGLLNVSRLDKSFFPNRAVCIIRKMLAKLK